jgi:hypothetical protein
MQRALGNLIEGYGGFPIHPIVDSFDHREENLCMIDRRRSGAGICCTSGSGAVCVVCVSIDSTLPVSSISGFGGGGEFIVDALDTMGWGMSSITSSGMECRPCLTFVTLVTCGISNGGLGTQSSAAISLLLRT